MTTYFSSPENAKTWCEVSLHSKYWISLPDISPFSFLGLQRRWLIDCFFYGLPSQWCNIIFMPNQAFRFLLPLSAPWYYRNCQCLCQQLMLLGGGKDFLLLRTWRSRRCYLTEAGAACTRESVERAAVFLASEVEIPVLRNSAEMQHTSSPVHRKDGGFPLAAQSPAKCPPCERPVG